MKKGRNNERKKKGRQKERKKKGRKEGKKERKEGKEKGKEGKKERTRLTVYNRTPLIRTLLIRIANYPDRLVSLGNLSRTPQSFPSN
jgi:hypothetical protein